MFNVKSPFMVNALALRKSCPFLSDLGYGGDKESNRIGVSIN
jgi:hypothetical protein